MKRKLIETIPFYLFFILLTFFVKENPFFWDSIQLGSIQAHWFYENGFDSIILHENIDSGHIPVFGFYLAMLWTLFGKTLMLSHLSILPFLLGIVYQLFELCRHYIGSEKAKWAVLLLLLDPVFLGQSVLVSPDVLLVFFFFLGWNSVLKQNYLLLTIASLGLAAVSLRGMMVVVVLFLFTLIRDFKKNEINLLFVYLLKKTLPFVPSGLFALAYLSYHYMETGWIAYHENSPWAACFEKVDFPFFIRNVGILGWRFLDFGKVLIWLFLFVILFQSNIRNWLKDKFVKDLLLMLFVTLFVITPNLLLHKYILSHRYLLPCFFSVSLLFTYLLFCKFEKKKWIKYIFTFVLLGLMAGNFWVYPPKVAQGWDATLGHLPYYNLKQEMLQYMEEENIDFENVGSVFPNISALKYTNLIEDERRFLEKDFSKDKYIFYSNVFNDFSDEELDDLENNWTIEKEYKKCTVNVILYKRK